MYYTQKSGSASWYVHLRYTKWLHTSAAYCTICQQQSIPYCTTSCRSSSGKL
nr:unnamed protein product [Callosobruchus analis]